MARRVYLHIGTMKAATTYLQALLDLNREQLAEAGVLWSGGGLNQRAVEDLYDSPMRPPGAEGTWDRLAEGMRRYDGDALMSMELLAKSSPEEIQRVARSLAPAEMHVILTARELSRALCSQWQEGAQNKRPSGWLEFIDEVCVDDPEDNSVSRRIWQNHDLARIIDAWSAVVPSERTWLVTIPVAGGDPTLVWRRFASVIGLDPERFEQPRRRNESLGAVSAELMRRLHLQADLEWPRHRWAFRRTLAKEILCPRAESEPRLAMPPDQHAWVRARATRMLHHIEDAKINVVGDLAELTPPPEPTAECFDPENAADGELLAAALVGLEGLGRRMTELRADRDRLAHEKAELVRQRDTLERQLSERGFVRQGRRLARRSRIVRWSVYQLRRAAGRRPESR